MMNEIWPEEMQCGVSGWMLEWKKDVCLTSRKIQKKD